MQQIITQGKALAIRIDESLNALVAQLEPVRRSTSITSLVNQCYRSYTKLNEADEKGPEDFASGFLYHLQLLSSRTQLLCNILHDRSQFSSEIESLRSLCFQVDDLTEALVTSSELFPVGATAALGVDGRKIKERMAQVMAEMDGVANNIVAADKEVREKAEKAKKFLDNDIPQLKDSVALAAGGTTSVFFENSANNEFRLAKYYIVATFIALFTLIAFSFYSYCKEVERLEQNQTRAEEVAKKLDSCKGSECKLVESNEINIFHFWLAGLPVTIFLTLLVALLGKEAGWHKGQAVQLRRLSLNVSTLSPFLSQLEIESKHRVLVTVAESIFTHDGKTVLDSSNPQEVTLELIRQLGKAAR